MSIATFYRAKIYQTFGLPNRPQITLAIAYGPLRSDCKRVQNHVNFINADSHPKIEAVLQKVDLAVA